MFPQFRDLAYDELVNDATRPYLDAKIRTTHGRDTVCTFVNKHCGTRTSKATWFEREVLVKPWFYGECTSADADIAARLAKQDNVTRKLFYVRLARPDEPDPCRLRLVLIQAYADYLDMGPTRTWTCEICMHKWDDEFGKDVTWDVHTSAYPPPIQVARVFSLVSLIHEITANCWNVAPFK